MHRQRHNCVKELNLENMNTFIAFYLAWKLARVDYSLLSRPSRMKSKRGYYRACARLLSAPYSCVTDVYAVNVPAAFAYCNMHILNFTRIA